MASKEKRPTFSETVVKTLFGFSNNVCGFIDIDTGEACEEQMTDPTWKRVNGEIAHIRGWAPGSARYEVNMTDEERNAFPNLLLLCPGHHKRVDDLDPDRYSVAKMEEMKERGSGASATGSDWAADAALAMFARDAIRQAVARAIGEMQRLNERQAVTGRLSVGGGDVAAAGSTPDTGDDGSRTYDSAETSDRDSGTRSLSASPAVADSSFMSDDPIG